MKGCFIFTKQPFVKIFLDFIGTTQPFVFGKSKNIYRMIVLGLMNGDCFVLM
ncbi:MAG: hypothetical protein LBL74_00540 [Bacteroidales bacterium]|nr:hypothetical protein [Bacteroidales bacterium]